MSFPKSAKKREINWFYIILSGKIGGGGQSVKFYTFFLIVT